MTARISPQSLLLSHGRFPQCWEAWRKPQNPTQSSPECFVKGQASEVKEAEILLCYQLAKFVTVIKEGVVSPFVREEDTVPKRRAESCLLASPIPAGHCRQDPRPRECSWPGMLLGELPGVPTASPRHLRTRDTCPALPSGQAEPPPKPAMRRRRPQGCPVLLQPLLLSQCWTCPLLPVQYSCSQPHRLPSHPLTSPLLLWQVDAAGGWSRRAQ